MILNNGLSLLLVVIVSSFIGALVSMSIMALYHKKRRAPTNTLAHLLTHQLIVEGFFNTSQADKVLEQLQTWQMSLIPYLINQKLINSCDIAIVASQISSIPVVDIESIELNPELIKLFDQEFLEQHQVLPLFMRGECLFVAISDPTNSQLIDDIKAHTNKSIEIILAENDKLIAAIKLAITPVKEFEEEVDEEEFEISDAPIVKFVNSMLHRAIKEGASALHFEPYEKFYRVRFRIDGILREIAKPPVQLARKIAARIKVMSRLYVPECHIPQDGCFKLKLSKSKAIDFRVSTCPTVWGEKVVLQTIDNSIINLNIDRLGFEEEQKRLYLEALNNSSGMVLVTGPTGSGKTVTLYTGLKILNQENVNISTIEDPVEKYFPGINQVQVDNRVGVDFAKALKAFLRQSPDIILIGEIRDYETVGIAFKAAGSRHLVLSALHTNDALQTVTHMTDMGISPFAIAQNIKLIISQRLVRCLCEHCKIERNIPEHSLLIEGFKKEDIPELKLYGAKPNGCEKCDRSGYIGRTGIFQVMPISDQMKQLIMKGRKAITLAEQARCEGIPDLRELGLKKVKDGLTSLEELNRVVSKC